MPPFEELFIQMVDIEKCILWELIINWVWNFFFKGALTAFYWGKVLSGYFRGAEYAEVDHYPNNDPNACSSTNGLTEMDADLLTMTLKKNNEEICCKGSASITFSPGLMNN